MSLKRWVEKKYLDFFSKRRILCCDGQDGKLFVRGSKGQALGAQNLQLPFGLVSSVMEGSRGAGTTLAECGAGREPVGVYLAGPPGLSLVVRLLWAIQVLLVGQRLSLFLLTILFPGTYVLPGMECVFRTCTLDVQ